MHRIGQACVLFTITVILLVIAELVARRRVYVGPPDDVLAGRAFADAYAGEPWVVSYFEEFAAVRQTSWQPYVYWRRRPHHGKYINIDERGLRRSWRPPQPGK